MIDDDPVKAPEREPDIVARLRQGVERYEESDAESAMDKAADEIERLLRVCKDKTVLLKDAYAGNERRDKEIERLRKALEEIADDLTGVSGMTLEELRDETLTQKHRRLIQEKCRHETVYSSTVSGPAGTFSNSFCLDCGKSAPGRKTG